MSLIVQIINLPIQSWKWKNCWQRHDIPLSVNSVANPTLIAFSSLLRNRSKPLLLYTKMSHTQLLRFREKGWLKTSIIVFYGSLRNFTAVLENTFHPFAIFKFQELKTTSLYLDWNQFCMAYVWAHSKLLLCSCNYYHYDEQRTIFPINWFKCER